MNTNDFYLLTNPKNIQCMGQIPTIQLYHRLQISTKHVDRV